MRTQFDIAWPSSRSSAATERWFLAACAMVFFVGAVITVRWCDAACCGNLAMPGGWSLSTTWTRGPGDTWPGAAASFLAMWTVMMVPMMLPCVTPMLLGYRRSMSSLGAARSTCLTVLVSAGYFTVWTLLGAVVYPIGAALGSAEVHWPVVSRSVPVLAGVVIAVAGVVQLTPWKSRQLTRCRATSCCTRTLPANANAAWRHGLTLGVQCAKCCLGLMLMVLAIGVMNVWVMAAATAAMAVERIAPFPDRVARAIGVLAIAAGASLVARGWMAI